MSASQSLTKLARKNEEGAVAAGYTFPHAVGERHTDVLILQLDEAVAAICAAIASLDERIASIDLRVATIERDLKNAVRQSGLR